MYCTSTNNPQLELWLMTTFYLQNARQDQTLKPDGISSHPEHGMQEEVRICDYKLGSCILGPKDEINSGYPLFSDYAAVCSLPPSRNA